jgi:tripartite-type tricarboxylate transporter receptor subunit TctC
MKRFGQWLCALAFLGCGTAAMAQAPASAFPSKVVTLMVPYPAGAASDFTARALSEPFAKALGGPVIVENIGGATGAIAAAKVLGAPADGHYLFQGSPSELILSGLVNKSTRYKPEDFQWIAPVATSPLVLVVNSKLPVHIRSTSSWRWRASRKDAPLSYGTPGPGTLYHLLGELFTRRTGAPLTHVPYKGGAPIIQDLLGGQIDFAFMPYQAFYVDYVNQGRLRLVGSLSPGKRLPAPFDTLQTSAQSKDMKEFDFGIWTSYMVRKGTPQPVAERLNAAIAAALKNPHARAQLESQAKTVFEPMSLEAGEKFYASEVARYRELVKTIGYESP